MGLPEVVATLRIRAEVPNPVGLRGCLTPSELELVCGRVPSEFHIRPRDLYMYESVLQSNA